VSANLTPTLGHSDQSRFEKKSESEAPFRLGQRQAALRRLDWCLMQGVVDVNNFNLEQALDNPLDDRTPPPAFLTKEELFTLTGVESSSPSATQAQPTPPPPPPPSSSSPASVRSSVPPPPGPSFHGTLSQSSYATAPAWQTTHRGGGPRRGRGGFPRGWGGWLVCRFVRTKRVPKVPWVDG